MSSLHAFHLNNGVSFYVSSAGRSDPWAVHFQLHFGTHSGVEEFVCVAKLNLLRGDRFEWDELSAGAHRKARDDIVAHRARLLSLLSWHQASVSVAQ